MAPPPSPIVIDAQSVSGITGSISIACWIIVFAPQIYQNFVRKSAEGVSLMFVILWLLGDIFNVLGAVLQNVLPTMIILALYYTFADIVLLWQCLIYGHDKGEEVDPIHLSPANPLTEDEPLLQTVLSNDSFSGPAENAEVYDDGEESTDNFNDIDGVNMTSSCDNEGRREFLYTVLMVLLVFLAGVGGWYFDVRNHRKTPPSDEDLVFDVTAQFFGWLCAILYLGSRIPQIILNFERKSCEGISFLFFLFACLGNITYVVSILAVATGKKYVLINLPWLIGSLGTLFEDFTIFFQFFRYRANSKSLEEELYEEEDYESEDQDQAIPGALSYDAV
ncbi:DEKNAAC102257 [Brettanomyces naardenensis]|uniref:DEKNAAC102257 n=1 Tax=Brettanomyces naardenensis TaxID=13370 RepID=A0A448YKQ3_BRENA|nr:DEKNAAC102257 [Brettanomyces naardenensis]